jgi:hypothetical protein
MPERHGPVLLLRMGVVVLVIFTMGSGCRLMTVLDESTVHGSEHAPILSGGSELLLVEHFQ